jgi:hypothetical protein
MIKIILVMLSISLACLIAIFVAWLRWSFLHPLQTTLRGSIGILAVLVGSLSAPTVEGVATLNLNLPPLLTLDGNLVTISTGIDVIHWGIAFGCISLVAIICLIRIPIPTE